MGHIPNKKQELAFKEVIKAIKAAQKLGLRFYGKQYELVAYTKEANDYAESFDFQELLRGCNSTIPYLSSSILQDSGADDYAQYKSQLDEDELLN